MAPANVRYQLTKSTNQENLLTQLEAAVMEADFHSIERIMSQSPLFSNYDF